MADLEDDLEDCSLVVVLSVPQGQNWLEKAVVASCWVLNLYSSLAIRLRLEQAHRIFQVRQ